MCGIAGIILTSAAAEVDTTQVSEMVQTIRHRGPDSSGVVQPAAGVVLGHARLAIIDPQASSNQPFSLDEGRLSMTYNGEVYNYLELRADLERLGQVFTTAGDTEVVLAAYRQWGGDCVRRFNGMWALAIYDATTRTLFCSRDRFGVKPFYYAHCRGRFIFASEIKAILRVQPHLAQPNYEKISAFLRRGSHSEGPATFFSNIQSLEPAHNLTLRDGAIRIERYWDYPTNSRAPSFDEVADFNEAADELRALLIDAIRLRMRSDVPVGSTLSGGVDSSSIVCLLRTFNNLHHDTFTASFPGHPWNEASRAEMLATQLDMEPHGIELTTDEIVPVLERVVFHMDAPTQCPAVVPLWKIMQEVRRHVVVALEGQGADELFGGYTDTLLPYAAADLLQDARLLAASQTAIGGVRDWGWLRSGAWAARALLPSAHHGFRVLRGDEAVYIGELARRPDPQGPRAKSAADRVTRKLHEQHSNGLRTLLQYGDAVSMAHSVESRLPFMDYRLVEFGFRLPGTFKLRSGHGKAILKRAVRGDVPAPILSTRAKLGFGTPVAEWFRGDSADSTLAVLMDSTCRNRGLFAPRAVQRLVRRHQEAKVDLSNQMLRWLTLELWFRHFIDAKVV